MTSSSPQATSSNRRSAVRRLAPTTGLALLCCALSCLTGCSREFYRLQADDEVYRLVHCASRDPHWALNDFTIEPADNARFYDPYDPDCQPMPPDDPTSHKLMHCVDCKSGWKRWHQNGDLLDVENPHWGAYLPKDEEGCVKLNMEDAFALGLTHSRAYQENLEDVYLSALDVSFERFRFDTQFYGGNDTFFTAAGRARSPQGSTSILETNTNVGFNKLFATGGTLAVDFANTFMWQFSGDGSYSASSLLSFSFIQPLLRGFGRQVVLERLTLSERVLLANVRAMERYRREFYVFLTTGRSTSNGPQRRGGVFGGAGLQGFTGLGGGFGRLAVVGSGGGGSGAAQAGGYMGLLQSQLEIQYLRDNVTALQNNLEVFRAFEPANLVDPFQVRDAEQSLATAESQLLIAVAAYERQMDAYKFDLGLPPDLCVKIEDDMLQPFVLQSESLLELRQQGDAARLALLPDIALVNGLVASGRRLGPLPSQMLHDPTRVQTPAERVEALDQFDYALRMLALARQNIVEAEEFLAGLARAAELQEVARGSLAEVENELRQLDEALPRREQVFRDIEQPEQITRLRQIVRDLNDEYREIHGRLEGAHNWDRARAMLARQAGEMQALIQPLEAMLEGAADDFQGLLELHRQLAELNLELADDDDAVRARVRDQLEAQFLAEFERRDRALSALAQQLDLGVQRLIVQGIQPFEDRFLRLRSEVNQLADDASHLGLIAARARLQSITLTSIDLDECEAIFIASQQRRDWMNARAGLVDVWRLIEFNANDLESDLNVVVDGELGTLGDRPLRFRDANSRIRVGFQFDAPLTRLAERNNYRQALIEYQQARREYMAYTDNVKRQLRDILRNLKLNAENFERRRDSVALAFDQFDFARLRLFAPPRAEETRNPNIARDVVTALSALQRTQVDFLSVWVNTEVNRRWLDLDLGTMMLDDFGYWVDPGSDIGRWALACADGEIDGFGQMMDEAELQRRIQQFEEIAPGDVDPANPSDRRLRPDLPPRLGPNGQEAPVRPDAARNPPAYSPPSHRYGGPHDSPRGSARGSPQLPAVRHGTSPPGTNHPPGPSRTGSEILPVPINAPHPRGGDDAANGDFGPAEPVREPARFQRSLQLPEPTARSAALPGARR